MCTIRYDYTYKLLRFFTMTKVKKNALRPGTLRYLFLLLFVSEQNDTQNRIKAFPYYVLEPKVFAKKNP